VYFVISGRGMIAIAGTAHAVTSGSVAFVPAGIAHHFHTVTEDLQVLVVFAPAEGTPAAASPGVGANIEPEHP
jgi:mannose-6-phosphate isomerase-like protein (cupin superfamily)